MLIFTVYEDASSNLILFLLLMKEAFHKHMTRANVTLALKYGTEEALNHKSRPEGLVVGILVISFFSLHICCYQKDQEHQWTNCRYLVKIISVYLSAVVQSAS